MITAVSALLQASFFFFFLSLEEAPGSNWISQQAFIRRSSSLVLSDLQLIELNQDQSSSAREGELAIQDLCCIDLQLS